MLRSRRGQTGHGGAQKVTSRLGRGLRRRDSTRRVVRRARRDGDLAWPGLRGPGRDLLETSGCSPAFYVSVKNTTSQNQESACRRAARVGGARREILT